MKVPNYKLKMLRYGSTFDNLKNTSIHLQSKTRCCETVKYNRSRNGLYVLESEVEKIFNQNFKIL